MEEIQTHWFELDTKNFWKHYIAAIDTWKNINLCDLYWNLIVHYVILHMCNKIMQITKEKKSSAEVVWCHYGILKEGISKPEKIF